MFVCVYDPLPKTVMYHVVQQVPHQTVLNLILHGYGRSSSAQVIPDGRLESPVWNETFVIP